LTQRRSVESWRPTWTAGLGQGYVCLAWPRHNHRTGLGGILWVLHTAAPWRELPARFGH
jgi:transposase